MISIPIPHIEELKKDECLQIDISVKICKHGDIVKIDVPFNLKVEVEKNTFD